MIKLTVLDPYEYNGRTIGVEGEGIPPGFKITVGYTGPSNACDAVILDGIIIPAIHEAVATLAYAVAEYDGLGENDGALDALNLLTEIAERAR